MLPPNNNKSTNLKNPDSSKILWFFDSRLEYPSSSQSTSSNTHSIISPRKERSETPLKEKLNHILDQAKKKREQAGKRERERLICDTCKSEGFYIYNMKFELVRYSIRKFVLVIRIITIKCKKCHKRKTISNPHPFFLKNLDGYILLLRNELRNYLKQNKFCEKCIKIYNNSEICPNHNIPLNIPKLVFIRGINQQYATSKLFGEEPIVRKKILVAGIANAGKSAIIDLIMNKNIQNAKNLRITKGIGRSEYNFNNIRYLIWDLGGTEVYREKYVKSNDFVFIGNNEIIYVFDIQDCELYDEAIEYLSDLIQIFIRVNNINKVLNLDLTLYIFLHKTDPLLFNLPKTKENVEYLTREIKKIDIPIKYEIFKTSIYNFEKNYSESLYSDKTILNFGLLASNLLSST